MSRRAGRSLIAEELARREAEELAAAERLPAKTQRLIVVDRRLYIDAMSGQLSEAPASGTLWSPGPGFTVSAEEAERVGYRPRGGRPSDGAQGRREHRGAD